MSDFFRERFSFLSAAHSPRSLTAGGKVVGPSTLPFLSQIAEEDLTSASTSVTSFHLPSNGSRRNPTVTLPPPPHRTLSDQDFFMRVNDDSNNLNGDLPADISLTNNKPMSYAHFNFDQSSKQLAKGNSLVSMSSESVDVPLNGNGETAATGGGGTRRKAPTTSPTNDSTAESSPALLKNGGTTTTSSNKSKNKLRKQTQDIAARAAQRRANLHHRELMEDMGE